MLDRLTRLQLSIFAIVTVLTRRRHHGVLSASARRASASAPIRSTANFVAGGGIYQNANVTYRGVTVGRVESVGLTDDGVVAHMRLNSGTPIPDNVTATVKSVSAVGEQYIDLVPPDKPSTAKLRNGASHRARTARRSARTSPGCSTRPTRLVASVGDTRMQDLLRETFKAFNGSGPELARLIQSSRLLVDEANANYGQVDQLIDQAGPFLDAQIRSGDDIKSLVRRAGPVHQRGRQGRPAAAVDPADRPGSRRRRRTRRSAASGRRSRCWPRTWPTSAGSA